MSVVLDASAVLALLRSEPGAESVMSVMGDAVISSVNAAEVMRFLTRAGASVIDAGRVWARLQIPVIAFGEEDLPALAEITQVSTELSLGDCACLALGKRRSETVLTADRIWGAHRAGVVIRQIRS